MDLSTADTVQPLDQHLCAAIQRELGSQLAGLYLFGSLVLGDFDPRRSDIDLLALTTEPLSDDQVAGLARMQDAFIAAQPQWAERLEILYLSLDILATFKTQPGPVARISP